MPTFDEILQGFTTESATAVLKKGIEYGAYEGDLPSDDDALLSEARELAKVAKTAYDGGVRGVAAVDILQTAGVSLNGDGGDAPPAESPGEGDFDIESVIPGYDDMKVKDIVEAMGKITDKATFEAVQAYEESTEERKSILKLEFTPPAPPPASAQAPAAATDQSSYGDSAALEQAYNAGSVGLDAITANQLPEPGVGELEIPVEIDKVSDAALAQLHTRYHNADVRALQLLGKQEGLRDAAHRLGDDAWNAAYARYLAEEKAALEKPTASGFDGCSSRAKHRAEGDDSIVAWRNREVRHGAEIRNLKSRQVGYEKGVARLSREQSRRSEEKEARRQGQRS